MGDEDDRGLVYDRDADGQHEVDCNHYSGGLVVSYGGMDLYCDNLEGGGENQVDHVDHVENLEGGNDAVPCDEQVVGDAHHDDLEDHNVGELALVLDGMEVHDGQVCDEQAHDVHDDRAYDEQGHEYNHDEDLVGDES